MPRQCYSCSARLNLGLVFCFVSKLVFKPSTLCSVHMLSCRGTGDESNASLSVWAHRSRCRQYRQISGPSVMNAHALLIGEWMRERYFGLPSFSQYLPILSFQVQSWPVRTALLLGRTYGRSQWTTWNMQPSALNPESQRHSRDKWSNDIIPVQFIPPMPWP
jgi:hypothetical protein